jgi:DNA invertase Pin-like site-specific DNA recombinase
MVLTRQEKEKLILDLYNQGKTYQQIAAIARVSVRDIKPVLEKAEKERENELGITTQQVNKGILIVTKRKGKLILVKHTACFQRVRLH